MAVAAMHSRTTKGILNSMSKWPAQRTPRRSGAQGKVRVMELTVHIPDDIATRMRESGGELTRRALEGLALEEFKRGRLSKPEMRRLLGMETRYQLDAFLKEHDVYEGYTLQDLEQQIEGLKRLGI